MGFNNDLMRYLWGYDAMCIYIYTVYVYIYVYIYIYISLVTSYQLSNLGLSENGWIYAQNHLIFQ